MTSPLAVMLLIAQAATYQAAPVPPRDAVTHKGTSVIRGKVVAADTGRPVRRVQVALSSPDLSESRSMSTTAQGLFEFKDLPAGRYTIGATRPGYVRLQYGQRRPGEPGRPVQIADGQRLDNIDFALPRSGWISGRVVDEVGDPLAQVTIYPAQWRYFRGKRRLVPVSSGGTGFNQTDDTGLFRITGLEPGDYYVLAFTRTTWTVDERPDERIGYLPTYSGGTANPAEAMRIKVGMGQDAPAGDITMVPGRLASISGTATYSSGAPMAGESINMTQDFSGPSWSSSFGMPGTKVNADGTFLIKNVPPGDLRLSVRGPGDKDHPAEGVTMTVPVAGEDVSGVTLIGSSGGSLSGRIVSDTGAAIPLPEQSRIRVSARPVDPTSTYQAFGGNQDNGRVKDDWTFEVDNVFGLNRLALSPLPTGWAIRSIDHGGKDYADTPIDVRGGARVDDITIVLSRTLPRVQGSLLDDKGQQVEGTVLLFPEDPSRWSEDSRLVRTARPDNKGAFEFRNVIPGTYLAVALDYVRDGEWADPEFLQNLRDRGKRVAVNDSGATGVGLTLK